MEERAKHFTDDFGLYFTFNSLSSENIGRKFYYIYNKKQFIIEQLKKLKINYYQYKGWIIILVHILPTSCEGFCNIKKERDKNFYVDVSKCHCDML